MRHHRPVSSGNPLSEAALQAAAGQTSFVRGEDYVRYVHGLRTTESTAHASIQARNVYLVDLDWSGRRLSGQCTCPHHARGNFCKHLVAVGLAAIDAVEGLPAGSARVEDDHLAVYLQSLDAQALRAVVREVADRHPDAARFLEIRAAAQGGDTEAAGRELVERVNEALHVRGFVDYRRSFDVAQDAQGMLDELEEHLVSGAHDAARSALLRALTRLRSISLHADDSSGWIGNAGQRAADLFARACRAGHPEPVKLARWLVRFRDDSPGWPETSLADFVPAFDEAALTAYRLGVEALDRKHAGEDHWHQREVQRMRLELADHDGDVDGAVGLLALGERPQYAAIVDRLRVAGRLDEVASWVDRGVAAGRIARGQLASGRDYWLDPDEVAGEYLALDRVDDASGIYRAELERLRDPASFAALISFAAMVGRVDQERTWALEHLRSRAAAMSHGSGALLVRIALAEEDLDAAWGAADEFGPGDAWRVLATASAQSHPSRAARLHRAWVDEQIRVSDSSRYEGIAEALATMRDLALTAGEEAEFAGYLVDLRAQYKRRPSLMAALARRGLQSI